MLVYFKVSEIETAQLTIEIACLKSRFIDFIDFFLNWAVLLLITYVYMQVVESNKIVAGATSNSYSGH